MACGVDRMIAARQRAAELARSGDYPGWVQVERTLLAEGWNEARVLFNQPQACQVMDEVCRIAQGAKAHGISYDQALEEAKRKR